MKKPDFSDAGFRHGLPRVSPAAMRELQRSVQPPKTSGAVPPVASVISVAQTVLHLSRFQELQHIDGEFLHAGIGFGVVDFHRGRAAVLSRHGKDTLEKRIAETKCSDSDPKINLM